MTATATPTRDLTSRTFRRVAEVKDQEGSFYIVKKGKKNTRVVSTSDLSGEGTLVGTEELLNERPVGEEVAAEDPTKPKRRQRFLRK